MKNVEDLFPLSPMQEMMLLHAVAAPSSDVLFNQFCFEIDGPVDETALKGAWQQLIDTHPILRAAFVWKNLEQPVQAIRKVVELPFESLDLSEASDIDRRAQLDAILSRDRDQPFDPSRAPLLRVKLVRLSDRSHFLIWSSHHLLLDRWCLPIVLDGLGRYYDRIRRNEPLPTEPRRSFRSYIGWIQQQDPSRAQAHWRQALTGFERGTAFSPRSGNRQKLDGRLASACLDEDLTARVRDTARGRRFTVSSMFQGAIALALARHCETADVVFGTTVSGRPPELDGVESIVGSFVNNIPVRVELDRDEKVPDWLEKIQKQHHERQAFDYVSRSDIETWSDLLPGEALFDTLFVWLQEVATAPAEGLPLRGVNGHVRTGYPVTISVTDQTPCLNLEVSTTDGGADAETVLNAVIECMGEIVDHAEGRLRDLTCLAGATRAVPREEPSFQAEAPPPSARPRSELANLDFDARLEHFQVTSLHDLLLKECRKLLRTNAFGPKDSFFESGGNSIHGVALHGWIQAATARSIPILALFQEPTVEGMVRTVSEGEWPREEGLTRVIRARGSKPPLFCIAAPGVETIGYAALTEQLDPERPVYVIQAPSISGDAEDIAMAEVPDFVDRYGAALAEIHPTGVVHILTMCGGAHVAVELARQLEVSGRLVDFVGVVNAWSFYTISWKVHLFRAYQRYLYYRHRLSSLSPGELSSKLLAPLRSGRSAVRGEPTRPEGLSSTASEPARETVPDEEDWWVERRKRPTQPECFNGTLTLMRLKSAQFFRVNDRLMGWGDYARDIDLRYLSPKHHLDIMRGEGLVELAAILEECLETSSGAR